MVIGRRLGSGRIRNGSFTLAQVPITVPWSTSNPSWRKSRSVCLSLSHFLIVCFWFLLGWEEGCPTSCANGVEHSGMSWGARRGCVYLWGWDKKVYTYFRR